MENISKQKRQDRSDGKFHGDFYDSQIIETSLPIDMYYCEVCDKYMKKTSLKRHKQTKSHKKKYDAFYMDYQNSLQSFDNKTEIILNPDKFAIGNKIQITVCIATGEIFSNLKPESEHIICKPLYGYKNDESGVWVLGAKGKPVKVLSAEFKFI
jgi:hypothetical protein